MVPVALGFSFRPRNPLSWLIRKSTSAKVSHCWMLMREPNFGQLMVVEAGVMKVGMVSYGNFAKRNQVVYLALPKLDLVPGMKSLSDWLDEWYDNLGLLGMAWVKLGEWLKQKWHNPLNSRKAMFCSELLALYMQAVPYPGFEVLEASSAEPADLLLTAGKAGMEICGQEKLPAVLARLAMGTP